MLIRARAVAKRQRSGVAFTPRRELTSRLKAALPWELTGDQQRALREITGDMTAPERMHRLLMGDVGTGKTVVALFAMLLAVENDFQAALMAPTELLAEQHAATLDAPAGAARAPARAAARPAVGGRESGGSQRRRRTRRRLVVGTHALMQESVVLPPTGARGDRRAAPLRRRAAGGADREGRRAGRPAADRDADPALARAHALWRPRCLHPAGAAAGPGQVRTAVRGRGSATGCSNSCGRSAPAGRQAYVVLPVIEESERADLRAATTMAEALAARWPELHVALVHGRLKPEERDEVMRRFRAGEIHVLVATTVIEVGSTCPTPPSW